MRSATSANSLVWRTLAATLLVLISLGVATLLLEVLVRTFAPTTDFLWQGDPDIGIKLIPGKLGRSVKRGEFDVQVRVNSIGFRDREHSIAKASETQRVVLLGDSFIEAIQVPFEESINAKLELRLRANGHPAEIINFGVSGSGTARQYLALRRYGVRYSPDLVLLFFVGNDISDNSRRLQGRTYLPYPRTTEDGKLARDSTGQPLFTPFVDSTGSGSNLLTLLKDHWKTYRFLRELVDATPAVAEAAYKLGLPSESPHAPAADKANSLGFFEIYRTPPKALWSEAWQVTEELLLATRDLAESNGAQFAVVLIPAAWEVYPRQWEQAVERIPAMRSASLNPEEPSRRLVSFLQAHGVAVFSLLPQFRTGAGKGPPLYIEGDGHWTSAGHELAADLLKDPISQILSVHGHAAMNHDRHK